MSATFNHELSTNAVVSDAPLIATPSTVEVATPDFISSYADYADVFEMPRQVHEWMAVKD